LRIKARDPEYDPLTGFFNWIKDTYGLTKPERIEKLTPAISNEIFDWKTNPVIDLRRTLKQAQFTIDEIQENELFTENLRKALWFTYNSDIL